MGWFTKKRSDGQTFDGQGEERRGLIDVVQYNGEGDDLLWRFPYDNLSTKTQLIVQEGQEAIFSSNGRIADVFGPGKQILSTNNIPILQKIINLPFGGNSPFKATVTFVNTTVRTNKWGTMGLVSVKDYSLGDTGLLIKVGSYGNCSLRIIDSAAFIREFAGTMHIISADDFQKKFREQISQYVKPSISRYFSENRSSITEINNYLVEIARYMQNELNSFFERFGISITDFAVAGINPDENDVNYRHILEAQQSAAAMDIATDAEARRYAKLGINYQQERQLDIMQTAASNEGASGAIMGAGMGIGMGVGMGGVMGVQMSQVAGVMKAQVAPPSAMTQYYIFINNLQQGPYSMPQLQQLITQGILTSTTLVWKQGMTGWAAAQSCADLVSLFMSTTPPPPPVL